MNTTSEPGNTTQVDNSAVGTTSSTMNATVSLGKSCRVDNSIEGWAKRISHNASFSDLRLNQRMEQMLIQFASKPNMPITQACGSPAQTKAAYRFIENDRITPEAVLDSIRKATAQSACQHSVILSIHDTTTLNLTGSAIPELGGIATQKAARGLHVHSTLAVTEDNDVLGLLNVVTWVRPQSEDETPEHKESEKWIMGADATRVALYEAAGTNTPPKVIHVADREGDFLEFFLSIDDNDDSAVIRSVQNRKVDSPHKYAHDAVRKENPIGSSTIVVPESANSASREAKVELRVLKVIILPDRQKYPHGWEMAWTLVELLEVDAPEGVEGLHWLLWTREPATTAAEALRVVAIYKKRWLVEEYHKALKSGCQAEALELRRLENLQKTLYMYMAVATRIVQLRNLGRICPNADASEVLTGEECEVLQTLFGTEETKKSPLTIRQAILWIGQLGGHQNRNHDKMPGIMVLWRGLHELSVVLRGHQNGIETAYDKVLDLLDSGADIDVLRAFLIAQTNSGKEKSGQE